MRTISSILRTLVLSSISVLLFAFINSHVDQENDPIDLQAALKAGTVSVKAVSNGKYSGNSIVFNVTNLTNKAQSVIVPAGTLYYPTDDEEQTLIQLEDQLIVLQGKETKRQLIAGFCSESSDRCPSEENTFKLGKSTDPKLVKLIDYLSAKKVDKATYQEAVWAITDAHSISSIYSDKTDIRDFRTFMADLTGQKDTWFSSPQEYTLDNRGNINRETVRISGQLTIDSDGNSPIHQELCDAEGNVLFTSSSSTPRKSKDVKMSFSVRVQGWKKGNYFVKIMDGTTELKRFDFVV